MPHYDMSHPQAGHIVVQDAAGQVLHNVVEVDTEAGYTVQIQDNNMPKRVNGKFTAVVFDSSEEMASYLKGLTDPITLQPRCDQSVP